MTLALFGLDAGGFNLAVNLLVLFLVVIWLSLVYWTYMDAKRRMEDPVLIMSATAASMFPFVGTLVYTILRPPEFRADAHERELEVRAAELRVRQLAEAACPNCEHPIERSYLRCPNCQVRLKDPCPSCSKPIDPRWSLCPFCETAIRSRSESKNAASQRQRRSSSTRPTNPPRQSGGSSGRPTKRPTSPTRPGPAPSRPSEGGSSSSSGSGSSRTGSSRSQSGGNGSEGGSSTDGSKGGSSGRSPSSSSSS